MLGWVINMNEKPKADGIELQYAILKQMSDGQIWTNADVLQAFGVNDYDTADVLSKTMARETITYETSGQSEKNVMLKDPERSLSTTQHLATRNLMDPNEIMKLAPDNLLLMRVGESPLIVKKLRYYADKEFAGMFMRRESNELSRGHCGHYPSAPLKTDE